MIELIIVVIVLGVLLYLVQTYIPMDPAIKTIVQVLVVIAVIVYLLRFFGIAFLP